MSRIGKAPITIPQGVTVEVKAGGAHAHQLVSVNGPMGNLEESIRPGVKVVVQDGQVLVTRDNDTKQNKSYHGLYRALINNMVNGVTTGYTKELQIVGIGYRAEMQDDKIILSVGHAHKISYQPPAGITLSVKDQTEVSISGIDRQLVGEVAAKIRSFRKPEPYKGKGIRYRGEAVRRKSVKQTK
jgi:large subunit ribosomal protein L6